MAHPFRAAARGVAPLVRATLDDVLAVTAPGATTTDAIGGAVPGDPSAVSTIRARVRMETTEERIQNARPAGVYGYTVRVNASDAETLTAAHSLVWSAAPGGARTLSVSGLPRLTSSGRFADVPCTART